MVRTIQMNDGKKIPALGWGNGTGGLSNSGQSAVDAGVAALKAGILHIDTAQVYGTEVETAKAIQAAGLKPEQVWVTTKISGSSKTQTTLEDIRRSVKESLNKLGFIPDMLLIHSPTVPAEGKIGEFWQHLETLVEDGTLKGTSLGVSNFRPQDLEAVLKVCKIKPAANQFEFHPYVLAHLDPVMKIHQEHGIIAQAYGPLQPILNHPTGGPLKPILSKIAKKLSQDSGKDVDEAAVLYLWTIGKGVCCVTSSKNPANIKKMGEIETLRDLTKEEMDEIEQAGRKVHYRKYGHMNKDFPAPDLPEDL